MPSRVEECKKAFFFDDFCCCCSCKMLFIAPHILCNSFLYVFAYMRSTSPGIERYHYNTFKWWNIALKRSKKKKTDESFDSLFLQNKRRKKK